MDSLELVWSFSPLLGVLYFVPPEAITNSPSHLKKNVALVPRRRYSAPYSTVDATALPVFVWMFQAQSRPLSSGGPGQDFLFANRKLVSYATLA